MSRLARLEADLTAALARLNPRQRAFVDAYWNLSRGGRAWRAAEAAGYSCPRSQGPRLRTFPAVAAALAAWDRLEDERIRLIWKKYEREEAARYAKLSAEPSGRKRRRFSKWFIPDDEIAAWTKRLAELTSDRREGKQ